MSDRSLEKATLAYLCVGVVATGVVAVVTASWIPMLVGYPLTLAGTIVLFILTSRAIDRS